MKVMSSRWLWLLESRTFGSLRSLWMTVLCVPFSLDDSRCHADRSVDIFVIVVMLKIVAIFVLSSY